MKGKSWAFPVMLLNLVAASLTGCVDAPAPPPSSVATSDTGGVRFVRVPPLNELALPELPAALLYSTADIGGAGLELFRVRAALFAADGTLVIANAGSEELLLVDPGGGAVRRLGGRGQGPGEFSGLSALIPAPGGGFFAWDYRLSRFGEDGSFLETLGLDQENPAVSMQPLAVFHDGRIAATLVQQRYFQPSGERRDTVPLLVFGHSGVDTVGTWSGLERAFVELSGQGTFVVPIGYGRTVFHASNGERIAIGSTDSLDVTVFDAELKPALRLVAPRTRKAVTAEERSGWRQYVLQRLPMDIDDVRRAWERAPVRETLPGFDGLAIDVEGRLWIGEAGVPGAATRRWVVFGPDGTPEGELRVPALWSGYLPGSTELLAVGRDRIALLRRNDMDEDVVDVWTVRSGT